MKAMHDQIIETSLKASNEAPFLMDMFEGFNQSGIRYCVLRNYHGLPYDLEGHDVDMLFTEGDLENATRIIVGLARRHNGTAIWWPWDDCLRAVLCWGISSDSVTWGVRLDMFTGLRWRGLEFYPNEDVFLRAIDWRTVRVADSGEAVLIAFLKKVLYHLPGSRYVKEAAAAYARSPDSTKKQMAAIFGKQGEALLRLLELQDIELLGKLALTKKLRRGLLFRRLLDSPLTVLKNKIRRHHAHWHRIWNRSGIFVAVLGLDGAGKTTLINLARRDLKRLLHNTTECRHWRPDFLPRLAALMGRDFDKTGAPNPNPHCKPPSGSFVSIMRLAYYSVDYILGFWLSVLPKLIKSDGGPTVVFFDRYFCDYFIDPARYSVCLPEWIVRLFWLVIPKPDLIIMLRPEPEVVYARKPELPVEELQSQGERMCQLAKKLKHVVWIGTSGKTESSCQEVVQAVLDTFTRRGKWQ